MPGIHSNERSRRNKVIWGSKRPSTVENRASLCLACKARGSFVDASSTTVYFVCPECQHTWHEQRRKEIPSRSS